MTNASTSTYSDHGETLEPFELQPDLDLSAYVRDTPVFVLESLINSSIEDDKGIMETRDLSKYGQNMPVSVPESLAESNIEDGKGPRQIVVARGNVCDRKAWWTGPAKDKFYV
jgi:hypothetical protein